MTARPPAPRNRQTSADPGGPGRGPSARRLFFALWPSRAVAERLTGWAREARLPGARLIPAERLHLTLAFLGAVDETRIEALEAAARRIRVAPFTLRLDQTGHWPRPQVFWAGAEAVPPELERLVAALRRVAAEQGLPVEARPFRVHATLARKVRRRVRGEPKAPVAWCVDEFALVASRTLPEGARYTTLARFALRR